MFARRNFLSQVIWEGIKEPTLGANLMDVMFATRDFPI
jgi:hypothetical protein